MKALSLTLALVMGLAVCAEAQVGGYKIESITPAVIPTPEYQFRGTDHRSKPEDWVEIEVKFSAQAEFTEELTVKYYVLLANVLLTGSVKHINIAAGRELYSVIYVPPQTLGVLFKGKPLTANDVQNVAVQLEVQGQTVSQESSKKAPNPNWFQAMPQIQGKVLNKNLTPFAPLYWDRYEMISPEGR